MNRLLLASSVGLVLTACVIGDNQDSSAAAADEDEDGFTGDQDCNDFDASVYPGAADSVGDGADQNCDGVDGVDTDGDGIASSVSGGTDCDDEDPQTYPGAAYEDSESACMTDADGDGFGDVSPAVGVEPGTDCDDQDPEVSTIKDAMLTISDYLPEGEFWCSMQFAYERVDAALESCPECGCIATLEATGSSGDCSEGTLGSLWPENGVVIQEEITVGVNPATQTMYRHSEEEGWTATEEDCEWAANFVTCTSTLFESEAYGWITEDVLLSW